MNKLLVNCLLLLASANFLWGHSTPEEMLLCNLTVDAGQNQSVCNVGEQVQLSGMVSDPTAIYSWTPTTGLSNPNSLNPTATVTGTATYTLEAQYVDPFNLVFNGDFNMGAVGFTSDYIPGTGGVWGLLSNEGQYAVANDPSTTHTNFSPCSDHTGDAVGNMMVINGAAQANQNVWCQTVTVSPGTNYEFTSWVAMVINSSPAILQFSINGTLIGGLLNANPAPCAWIPFSAQWNSGGNTTAEICIVNQNTNPSGNDFALDDISFNEVCTATDEVTVTLNEPASTFISETVCADNNCVLLEGQVFCGAGLYVVDLFTAQGCESTLFLTIEENTPQIIFPPIEDLSCQTELVLVSPVISTNGQAVSFLWSGPNGFTSVDQNIIVGEAGGYLLTTDVMLNGQLCTIQDVIIVEENIDLPLAEAGDNVTLGCGDSFPVTLDASGSDSGLGIDYFWTGPGVSSSDVMIDVNMEGTFTLLVVNSNTGCQSVDQVTVTAGTDFPEISPTGGLLNCNTTSLELDGMSQTAGVNYSWTGPGGFSSSMSNPTVATAGYYYLTISSGPNCTAVDSALVTQDTLSPLPTIQGGGTLTCDLEELTLTADASDPSVNYSWMGPGGFSGVGDTVMITMAGTYTLVATASNGCTGTAEELIAEDENLPEASADGGLLNCTATSIELSGSSTTADVVVGWTGPGGFSSALPNPSVSEAGEYIFSVAAMNGCTTLLPVQVTVDTIVPMLSVTDASLSCTTTETTLQATSNGTTVQWTGPGGFSSNQLNPMASEVGVYQIEVSGDNGCAAVDSLELDVLLENVDLQLSGGELDCTANSVSLTASSSFLIDQYNWSSTNGFMSTSATPMVGQAGTYILEVFTAAGCTGLDSIVITADADLPNISATGGSLFCDPAMLTIQGSSTTADVTYSWSGPNGFSSADAAPVVTQPGDYTFSVSAMNGCVATQEVEVVLENDLPNISATGGTIFCEPDELVLQGSSTTANVTFLWDGPNGFSSNDASPTVEVPGDFTLSITGDNGCVATQEVTVMLDNDLPNVNAIGGDIGCDNMPIQLTGVAPTATAFSWTGPNGFMSSLQDPMVETIGEYFLTVEGANGCSNTAQVEVMSVGDIPDVAVVGGLLDCTLTPVMLTANSQQMITDYNWSGPGGFSSAMSNPSVSQAGEYFVTITNAAGCMNVSSTIVTQDGDLPTFALVDNAAIDCGAPMAQLNLTLDDPANTVEWIGPNGFSSQQQQPTIETEGTYTVTITSANGCESIGNVVVSGDFLTPAFTVNNSEIDCSNPMSTLEATLTNASQVTTVEWIGPNGPLPGNGLTTSSNLIGNYTVTIIANNGCSSTQNFAVQGSTDLPTVTSSDVLLNCNLTAATLNWASDIALVDYSWEGPNGFQSNAPNPMIDQSGMYTLVGNTIDGCQGSTIVNVTEDLTAPIIVSITAEQLDCQNAMAEIVLSSDDPTASITWTGPNNFTGTGATLEISTAGDYIATAVAANGCSSTDMVEVLQDTDLPQLTVAIPALDCLTPNDNIMAAANIAGGTFEWSFQNMIVGQGANLNVTTGGEYVVSYSLPNGCANEETVFVQADFTEPQIGLQGGEINCWQPDFELTPTTTSAITSWQWSGSNGFVSQQEQPVVNEADSYTLTATAVNGCVTTITTAITADFESPDFSIAGGVIDCINLDAPVAAIGNGMGYNFSWEGPSNFTSNTQVATAVVGGIYDLTIIGDNGCDQILSVEVIEDNAIPLFSLSDALINCSFPEVELGINGADIPGAYLWSGPNGYSSIDENITVGQAGEYTLQITAGNGCVNESSTVVDSDLELPSVIAYGAHLSCNEMTGTISFDQTEAGNFQWTGPDGAVYNSAAVDVEQPGNYNLLFTADDNGCASSAIAEVTQDDPLVSEVQLTQPACPGEQGQFVVTATDGGVAPYVYSTDGGNTFSPDVPFGTLAVGLHNFVVQDAGECSWDTSVVVASVPPLSVQLLSSIEIDYGDQITLQPTFTFPIADILSVQWIPSTGLSCDDCLYPSASPEDNTTYKLNVTTVDGCEASSDIFLRINNDKSVYIPNVFSPNGDGANEAFTVFADTERIQQVDQMIIYDRWGEEVYRTENFPVNDYSYGWDGKLKGELMNPAVFVYYVELTFLDGSQETFKGDVTLVR